MSEHERVQELAAAYALGALTPSEREDLDAHLAECEECLRETVAFQAVGDALARSVTPLAAPPELRARIVAAATDRPQAVVSRRQWGGWAIGIAAAAVAVAVGVDDIRKRQELAAARRDLAAVDGQLTLQRAVAQPVLEGQPYVRLAPVSGSGPSAIWINPAGKKPYLAAPNLPNLQPDQIYELWFLQGSKPVAAGTFQTGSVLTLPPLPGGTTAMAITVEPSGGSAAPTTKPIMVGKV